MNAMEQTLSDVERLIHSTVWRFVEQRGGDAEEMTAEAMLQFAECYHAYDGDKAAFTTFLTNCIWWRLSHLHERKRSPVPADLSRFPARREFALSAMLESMSAEGRRVAELALNPPPDVRLAARNGRGEAAPSSIRAGIKQYLRDIGWTASRINTVFNEIREALT